MQRLPCRHCAFVAFSREEFEAHMVQEHKWMLETTTNGLGDLVTSSIKWPKDAPVRAEVVAIVPEPTELVA